MKKKNLKKVLGILLIGVLTFSTVGCGGKGKDKDQTGSTESGKTDDTIVDLGGYEFVVGSAFIQNEPDMEIIMGSERSFEEARRYVEDTYNCKITITSLWPSMENLRAKTMTGDKYADVIQIPARFLSQAIKAGYVQSLESIGGIYTDDYRWVDECTSMGTYDGVEYGVNFMRPSEVRSCLVYNREILTKYGITEDLEQLVRDKQWTFEKFEEIAKACTKDTNGDGTLDVYGIVPAIAEEFGLALINSNGGSLVTVENGQAKENFTSEETVTALNYLSKWINEDKIVGSAYNTGGKFSVTTTDYANYFVKGECAFLFCESWLVAQNIKNIAGNLDYGMVPVPMGPDAEDYVSTANDALVFAFPSTNTEDVSKSVIIMNALAKYVAGDENDSSAQEAYDYDIMMEYFGKEDEDAAEMYNMILSKSYLDLGSGIDTLLAEFKTNCILDPCYRRFGTPTSAIESISGMYDDLINSVYNNK